MPSLELNIVAAIPETAINPIRMVIDRLNALQPDWLRPGAINLKLVDDAEIQALNRDYSGNDYATDVLSFSYLEMLGAASPAAIVPGQESEALELGDLVISLETAGRQALQAGTSLADELATLTLHGILHVYGFDHANSRDMPVMDEWQRQVLGSAGVQYRNFNWINE